MAETDPIAGHRAEPEATIAITPGPESSASGPVGPASLPCFDPPRADGELGRLAHYVIRRKVGEGGMGLVYLAEDEHLRRQVAIKVIRPELAGKPEAVQRFLREARSAASIKHDHVVTIYQVGQHDEFPFLAMEFLKGISLQGWLDRGKEAKAEQVFRLGREVALGLAAAHSLGLVHRDIKPANIWLEAPGGRSKILDFGHARARSEEDVQITRAGAIMGTPAFMAPEQARGEPADASSDLFSLGCVLYRLAAGRLPFPGTTIMAVLTSLAVDTPPPPRSIRPEVPATLDDLIMRLLSKDPAGRPESARAVVDAIREAERLFAADRSGVLVTLGGDEPALALTAPPKPGQVEGIRPIRAGVAVIGALLVILGAIFVTVKRSANRPRPDEGLGGPEVPIAAAPDLPVREVEVGGAGVKRPGEGQHDPEPEQRPPPAEEVGPTATPVTSPPTPTVPLVPVPVPVPPPSLPASSPTTADWGTFLDPDGDCKASFDREAGLATIGVPGRAHALSVEANLMNAPRLLRPVRGDFQASVRVRGTDHPSGRPTTRDYAPYHGAGLLVWQDRDNYVRLEIATDIRKGKPWHYVNFEYRKAGKLAVTRGPKFDDGSTFLRLDRRGEIIRAWFGPDDSHWTALPALPVELRDDIEIGLAAINTASTPLKAKFEGFEVASPSTP